ncbi:MAG: hypothetical protein AAGA72_15685 [Pseudomonadota bacterium]
MALAERPDPRKKLVLAAVLDTIIVMVGVVLFVVSGSLIWIFAALGAGAVISLPLIVSGIRGLKEHQDAAR